MKCNNVEIIANEVSMYLHGSTKPKCVTHAHRCAIKKKCKFKSDIENLRHASHQYQQSEHGKICTVA